jgi:ATP-dependent Clp protease ATP-binding subunit ClpC
VDLTEFLSQQAEKILQQATRTAVDWGASDVDSEHLLYALADNDVVQAIFERFKLSPEDLKRQAQEVSPRREGAGREGRAARRTTPC